MSQRTSKNLKGRFDWANWDTLSSYLVRVGFLSIGPSLGFVSYAFFCLSSRARLFSDNSSYSTISTSVTPGGLVVVVRSSQNLPFAEGLPLFAPFPSMIALPLLFASFTYPPKYFCTVSNVMAPNSSSWVQIALISSEQRA